MLLWLTRNLKEISGALGPDPWPYGLGQNRKVIDTLVRYMVEQHLVPEPMDAIDLSLPVTE